MGHFSCSISFSKSDQKHICLSQIPFSVSDHKPKHSTVICSFLFSLQDILSPKKKMSYYFHSKVFFPFLLKLCQSHSNCKHKLFAKRIILNESIYEERIIKFSDVLPEISINMWLRETKPKATKISDFAWENVTKNCHKNLQIGKNKNEQTKWICISFKRTWVTASPQIFLEKATKNLADPKMLKEDSNTVLHVQFMLSRFSLSFVAVWLLDSLGEHCLLFWTEATTGWSSN